MSRKTRKFMWSVPLVAAFAVVGALALFLTLQPNDATAQDMELPGMVQNLMVKAYADGTPQEELEVTWDAPTDGGFVDSYRIDLSEDGMRWVSYITDHGDSDLSIIYGDDAGEMLTAEQTMHFRVFAFNEDGIGPGTDASGATTASHVPDRPTGLSATNRTDDTALTDFGLDGTPDETDLGFDVNGDGDAEDGAATAELTFVTRTMIMLEWTAPDDPPGASVTGYRIEYSRDGNRWLHLADTGKAVTSYYHTGLRADVEMQYRIYAENSVGRSTVSDGTTGNTATSAAPGAPTLPVIGLSPAATDVHLKWTPPANPAGDPVTHYRIQARTAGSETADDDMWMPLHAGKHIAVTNVYNFGGRDLTRAKIEYPATIATATTGDNTTSLVVIDIRIAAINRMNTDDTDAEIATATGWLEISDVPVGHEDAPKRAGTPRVKHDQSQHQGRSGLDVTWPTATFIAGQGPMTGTPPVLDGASVSYILVIDDEEQTAVTHTDSLGTQATPVGGDHTKPGYDNNGLATETERKYQVYALVSAATITLPTATPSTTVSIRGFPSNEAKGKTARPKLPGRPEDLTVTADGHTEIKLTWMAPAGATAADADCGGTTQTDTDGDGSECGDSVLKGYQIEMSETGTSGWQTLMSNDEDDETPTTIEMSPYLAKMLTPGKRYHFRVAALNSRGKGQYSEVKSEATHEAGEPTPPGGLVAQTDTHTTIKLCWYEQNLVDPLTGDARLDEGLPVLGYQITYAMITMNDDGTEKVGDAKTLVANTMSKDTVYTAMGLMPNTKYMFWVRSITLGGVGTKYTSASAMTADGPVDTTLTRPMNVMATSDATGTLTLTWEGGANADHFILIAVNMTNHAQGGPYPYDRSQVDGMATTGNVTGLSPGAPYLGIVVAVQGTGADLKTLHGTAGEVTVQQ